MTSTRRRLVIFGVELAGYAALTTGAFLIFVPAGWIVLGASLLVQSGVIPTRGKLQ